MTIVDYNRVQNILRNMAADQGVPVQEIRRSIQEAIDEAWDQAWQPGNLHAQVRWQQLFPGGEKPSLEAFIVGIADQLS